MTTSQRDEVERLFGDLAPRELHHGGAVGADREAHNIALSLSVPCVTVYPSNDVRLTANLGTAPPTTVVTFLEPSDPLKRNKAIVRAVDVLIAAPASAIEEVRSGTWHTIRRARARADLKLIILSPHGGML